MTGLEIFDYAGQQVRTVMVGDEPWFVAADVCRILGISNSRMAVARLDRDGVSLADVIDSVGRAQSTSVLSESGLYELVLRSDKPEARKFRRWVTAEVLPAIRRTGTYTAPAQRELTRLELIDMARDAEVGRIAAEAKVAELEPSASAWDNLASTTAGDLSVNEAAKVLSRDPAITIGETRLWNALFEWGWIYRDAARDPRPYQQHLENGRLACRARHHHHPRTGELVVDAPQIRVTTKGLAAIRDRLVQQQRTESLRLVKPA
jgi:anti-repressor protein